ncbi:MAG TPA: (2Fe-2S)-binding protein, partial [Candidatus Eisenbacteria bacterium]
NGAMARWYATSSPFVIPSPGKKTFSGFVTLTSRAAGAAARVALELTVNGTRRRVRVPPMKRLLDVLRDECGLTGTKEGCGEGECGACTVLLGGRAVNSCLVPAIHADRARVLTVEGLARGGRLSALQQAFVEMGAAQCGICTPGMLVSACALIAGARRRVPSEDEVREALAGNLCRCTGYQKIVDAVRAAAGAKTRRR